MEAHVNRKPLDFPENIPSKNIHGKLYSIEIQYIIVLFLEYWCIKRHIILPR